MNAPKKNDAAVESATDGADPFADLSKLRLDQSFVELAGAKKLLTTVPVRKPLPQDFVRVHPGAEFRMPFAFIDLKDDRERYLVMPNIAAAVPTEIVMEMLYTAINRQGVVFLWPVRLPAPDGRVNVWHRSQQEAAELAMKRWVRVKADMALSAYAIFEAPSSTPDPVWLDYAFADLLRIGFRDRMIDSVDHPVLKRLRGHTGRGRLPSWPPNSNSKSAITTRMLDALPYRHCMVAKDLRTGHYWRLWRGEFESRPPFPIGADALFVAYYASAELGCFRALDWPMPVNVLDLFIEFRNRMNGLTTPAGAGLVGALTYFGLDTVGATEKKEMIERILLGEPYPNGERVAILDYCAGDVAALERLLPAMLPQIDLLRAPFRGRYMKAAAAIEWNGVPIDTDTLALLREHWTDIQDQLINDIDADYGVFDGRTFKAERWERYLIEHGIPWPRLESGRLDLSDGVFRQMAKAHPQVSPMRELRSSLSELRLNDLSVGQDGRNRTILSAFRSRTGRNQPGNTKYIFGPSVWLRSLIKPLPGFGVAYIDWSQQEFGIAAALSGDTTMMAAYKSGDPYLEFAKQARAVPADATKASHGPTRELFKQCVLATQYGMEANSLAGRIGQPLIVARDLLRAHHDTYRIFWRWSDRVVDHAMLTNSLYTAFGWYIHVDEKPNPRSLRNFLMQANGAEMLRLACCDGTGY
jgi:DNA polymerase I